MSLFLRFLTRFYNDLRGNVAMVTIAGLSLMIVVGGAAIDFNSQRQLQSRLQDAVDQAVLAGVMDATGTLEARRAEANLAFQKNIANSEISQATGNFELDNSGLEQVGTYTASLSVETIFIGLVGIDHVNVDASANATISLGQSEIAFVLDNTGSMSRDSRMTYLKSSVNAVLDTLLNSAGTNTSGTKVAIVPFDTQVNIQGVNSAIVGEYGSNIYEFSCSSVSAAICDVYGDEITSLCASAPSATEVTNCRNNVIIYYGSNRSGSRYYVSVTSNYSQNNGSCRIGKRTYDCNYTVVARDSTYTVSGGVYTFSVAYDYSTPYNSANYYARPSGYSTYTGTISQTAVSGGGYGSGYSGTYKDNDTITANEDLLGVGTANWNGCIIDRIQPYDVSADSPNISAGTGLYPASKCATNNLLPIKGLSTDVAAAKTHVTSMNPAGNTNITIGVQWGMEVLSPGLPFDAGVAFHDAHVTKYMIIVTDGQNTQNRWTTRSADIDARTLLACQAAKDQGIVVYTVRVMEGNSTMLQQCASGNDHYFNVNTASELPHTLSQIMLSIKKIRLTR